MSCWVTAPSEPGLWTRTETFTFDGDDCDAVAASVSVARAAAGDGDGDGDGAPVSELEPDPAGSVAPADDAAAEIAWVTDPLSPGLPTRMSTFMLLGALGNATAGGVGAVGGAAAVGAGVAATRTGGAGELPEPPSARAGEARPNAITETAPAATPAPATRPIDRAARVRKRPAEACLIYRKYPVGIRTMQKELNYLIFM